MAKTIGHINVEISYKIIELFSAGLYSSPNKAFEELICNSYDAFAEIVSVFVSPDLAAENAYIMICDDGEGINQDEFHDLWKIGESTKRQSPERDKKRLQIGRFGIGKLSTYVLARKLTHISKKDGRFIMTTMDYDDIHSNTKQLSLPEKELSEEEAKEYYNKYCIYNGSSIVDFDLFGDKARSSWTICLLTDLKAKASEIQIGRLKWLLRTAMPLNPSSFHLYLNGEEILSSKTNIPVLKEWIVGKDDATADELSFAKSNYDEKKDEYTVDLETLSGIKGSFLLYEQSLVGGKSSANGRSHGIFLIIRGRLINLDDPLLGMEPFSHGPFNHCQIIINADGLDEYLASTREAVRDSVPYVQLKEYIKKKFNNEVRKCYFENEARKQEKKTISYRLSQTGYSTSQKPIRSFVKGFYSGTIANPLLIEKPTTSEEELLKKYEDQKIDGVAVESIDWAILGSLEPIGKLNLEEKKLTINSLHPFVANYSDSYKNTTPLENIIITEVLTEAYLYEHGLDESVVNSIIRKRDSALRELAFSDKEGIPAVAQLLNDSLSNPVRLENAVYRALNALGFETVKIGGNGKPDGMATAVLGYNQDGSKRTYSLTYDAKSTSKEKISAGTAHLSALKRHQEDYKANYSIEISIGYEGQDNPDSAISKESTKQKITVMKASDLARLLLYSIPNHLGLSKLQDLFDTCYTPAQVTEWVDNFIDNEPEKAPYSEIIEIVFELQKNDTEPPTIEVVRYKLNERLKASFSSEEIKTHCRALENIIPGQFHFDGTYVSVDVKPDIAKSHISQAINASPLPMKKIYEALFQ